MAVKYMLAARSDASKQLLPLALPSITRGLQDGDDDVRAAAAEALVPVAGALFSMGPEAVQQVGQQGAADGGCSKGLRLQQRTKAAGAVLHASEMEACLLS